MLMTLNDTASPALADRQVVVLALAFVRDVANISRDGGDLLEPLVFAAIVQANQAALRSDPEVRRRYGDSGEAIPDDLRRPISVNAVAQSLGLPFETARRKVRQLAARGDCVSTPAGVYVPRAAIISARHAAIQVRRMARLARFQQDLVSAGFLAEPRPLRPELVRTINRALSEYMLRSCDRLIQLAGGVLPGFVLLGLCAANTEGHNGGDAASAPCTARALADQLATPMETVRRHLVALRDRGQARRTATGWVAADPVMTPAQADYAADIRRLFQRLDELAAAEAISS
jgi:hypothetical protein